MTKSISILPIDQYEHVLTDNHSALSMAIQHIHETWLIIQQ